MNPSKSSQLKPNAGVFALQVWQSQCSYPTPPAHHPQLPFSSPPALDALIRQPAQAKKASARVSGSEASQEAGWLCRFRFQVFCQTECKLLLNDVNPEYCLINLSYDSGSVPSKINQPH